MAILTNGQLLTGLLYKYVENFDFDDIPAAFFEHKDTGGEWSYNLVELQEMIKKRDLLGITNNELSLGLVDLQYAQNQYNRIKPIDNIHSFFH